ncbi:MAG: hypothetical protein VKP63_03135 [Cyanobacteriota bacterium]|nr:hypothetical protein [Cyanobacteriota bacterium]
MNPSTRGERAGAQRSTRAERVERPRRTERPKPVVLSSGAEMISLREDRREIVCSVIALSVKLGLVVMAGVSLVRLAGAYQARMERQAELTAVLELEKAQLAKARNRFDELFMVAGEQKLIREQSQWIAPNRLRVVWQSTDPVPDRPVLAMQSPESQPRRP